QLILRRCGLLQDAPDALSGKIKLGKGDAAVEYFGVMGDQVAPKPEAADPLEQHGPSYAFGQPRGVAEPKSGITNSTVAYRIDKLPEIAASGVVEALQHRNDRRPPAMGSEKAVFVNTVLGEQHRQMPAVISLDRLREGGQQLSERMGSLFGSIHRYLARLKSCSGSQRRARRWRLRPRRQRRYLADPRPLPAAAGDEVARRPAPTKRTARPQAWYRRGPAYPRRPHS